MIATIKYGKGFKGILKYALEKPGAYLIGAVRGSSETLGSEFAAIRGRNPHIKQPVLHLSLSIHPEDQLDDERWERISKRVMEGLGYGDNRYVVIHHTDEPHDHIHIVACRIRNTDAHVVDNYREMVRTEKILRDIEKVHGLRRVPMSADVGKKRPTHAEQKMQERTRQRLVKQALQQLIDAARKDRPTLTVFLYRLNLLGVGIKTNVGGDRITGISFEIDGMRRKGSQLGKNYGWGGLLKTLDYDPRRDLAVAKQFATGVPPGSPSTEQERLWVEGLLAGMPSKRNKEPTTSSRLNPIRDHPNPTFTMAFSALSKAVRRLNQPHKDSPTEDDEQEPGAKKRDRSR